MELIIWLFVPNIGVVMKWVPDKSDHWCTSVFMRLTPIGLRANVNLLLAIFFPTRGTDFVEKYGCKCI